MIASLSVDSLSYSQLKEICNCSDGNMATHTKKLLAEGFIDVKKEFIDNKPRTTYILTPKGRKEFFNYLEIIKDLLKEK